MQPERPSFRNRPRPAWWPEDKQWPPDPSSFRNMPRPAWWPADRQWPPQRRNLHRSPFFRRLGCFFGLFMLLGFSLVILLIAFMIRSLGLIEPDFMLHWGLPLGLLALLLIVVTIVFAVFGLRRISAPLDDLLAAAGRLAEGDYSPRVRERGSPEVRSLARTFNKMAARLGQADRQRRNLLADATHELLTPLTIIQGNLEGMLDGVYPADETRLAAVLDETRIMARLIEDLRTLSLAESGALRLNKEPTDLLPFLRAVSTGFQAAAQAAGVHIELEAASDLPVIELDPGRMHQVLGNLLSNALRYSPPGGVVRLACQVTQAGIQISVQDQGPGIPPDDLEHIFERFYRSTDSGGMGLGLAIARHLVAAHGGSISAENAPAGGSLLRILLPLAEESDI